MDLKEMKVRDILTRIENHEKIISAYRDKLREIYDELETAIESFDRGIDGLHAGKREIEYALDALSEQI
jgi:exonuclease VII small subunit